MRVLGHPGTLLGLLLLLVAPGEPATGSPQAKVDCICHNGDYVICDWGSQQKPVHNYSFYFWFELLSKPSECKDYIQKDGLNVACHISNYDLFNSMGMHLNDSQGQTVVHQELRLSNRVRPGRPFNLTLSNLSNHQLLLTWKTPYEIPECLEHLIRYKSNKDTEFMEHSIVNSLKFQIPSVDPEKRYTFYVKSKRNNNCATTDLWSEESEPAFWGKGERGGQEGVSTSQESRTGNKKSIQPALLLGTSPASGSSRGEPFSWSTGTSCPSVGCAQQTEGYPILNNSRQLTTVNYNEQDERGQA